jgi:predicted DCC family thiol-disulfide oxidoreductase YuxK
MSRSASPATVFYDADCGFCLWCVAKLMAWDTHGRLRYATLQDPVAVAPVRDRVGEDRLMESWHLLTEDGHIYSAGSAFFPLLRHLPGGGLLAPLVERLPERLLDRAYYWVADRRSAFGRLLTDGARHRARARVTLRAP